MNQIRLNLSHTEYGEALEFFLNEPMAQWGAVAALKTEAMQGIVRDLDAIIERAVRFRGYVDTRIHHDHTKAVKASNSLATKVRRAIGYAYPRKDVRF